MAYFSKAVFSTTPKSTGVITVTLFLFLFFTNHIGWSCHPYNQEIVREDSSGGVYPSCIICRTKSIITQTEKLLCGLLVSVVFLSLYRCGDILYKLCNQSSVNIASSKRCWELHCFSAKETLRGHRPLVMDWAFLTNPITWHTLRSWKWHSVNSVVS